MQNYGGFSNPFGTAPTPNINQGYTGYQDFSQPQQPQVHQSQQANTKKSIRQSKIATSTVLYLTSTDHKPNKRLFKGKYELNAEIPVRYNTVDYFMLVENVRINNETALRELKRGKASEILDKVMDSLEFLSYIHK